MKTLEASSTNKVAVPHAVDAEAVLESLGSDRVRGLSSPQVSERVGRYGHNLLAEAPPGPL